MFPIQITGGIAYGLTSFSTGVLGLIGFLVTLWIYIKDINRFALFVKLLSGCVAVLLLAVWILGLLLPTFRWIDRNVYRNGDDYLVLQEQETFVTSNLKQPRLIRTKSPYSMIRKIEEQGEIKENDYRFSGDVVIYNGKKWLKERSKREE
ncbi:hypothetical protein [Mucilaginibacter kameinonensis]|uniref:hypothetical protein n=1 Tax=Mucilaginibacter kameinonensis TaxID=452286 RepID=UPI0013CF04EA|nr:hypothetical protein [Mucilaginibacter kameinonensis]